MPIFLKKINKLLIIAVFKNKILQKKLIKNVILFLGKKQ
jgi:hypothetical protein